MALLATKGADLLLGVRLCGAESAMRSTIHAPATTSTESALEPEMARACAELGSDAFDAVYAEGGALTLDEAVAYALGEVTWDDLAPIVAEQLDAGRGTEEDSRQND